MQIGDLWTDLKIEIMNIAIDALVYIDAGLDIVFLAEPDGLYVMINEITFMDVEIIEMEDVELPIPIDVRDLLENQLGTLLGLALPRGQAVHETLFLTWQSRGDINLIALLVGAGATLLLYVSKRWTPRLPADPAAPATRLIVSLILMSVSPLWLQEGSNRFFFQTSSLSTSTPLSPQPSP